MARSIEVLDNGASLLGKPPVTTICHHVVAEELSAIVRADRLVFCVCADRTNHRVVSNRMSSRDHLTVGNRSVYQGQYGRASDPG